MLIDKLLILRYDILIKKEGEKQMKKIIAIPILILTIFLIVVTFVDFTKADAFPVGKNYIDSKNVYKQENFIYTDKPFLIKNNTRYTFSISRRYVDGAPFEVIIDFYQDKNYINNVSRDRDSLNFDIPTNTYYFTFLAPPNANFADLRFIDNDGKYVTGDELADVQFEEGETFTTYEPYQRDSFSSTTIFYVLLVGLPIIGIGVGVSWHFLTGINKKKKRKTR
jgi:hypothetical protein